MDPRVFLPSFELFFVCISFSVFCHVNSCCFVSWNQVVAQFTKPWVVCIQAPPPSHTDSVTLEVSEFCFPLNLPQSSKKKLKTAKENREARHSHRSESQYLNACGAFFFSLSFPPINFSDTTLYQTVTSKQLPLPVFWAKVEGVVVVVV